MEIGSCDDDEFEQGTAAEDGPVAPGCLAEQTRSILSKDIVMVQIRKELEGDLLSIETLLDLAFGTNRKSKTSYRYRSGIEAVDELSHVAETADGELVGSIRYWPIEVSGHGAALLLGPLAIHPDYHGRGIGRALVFSTLAQAEALGHELVFLVGDPDYYRRFGFAVAPRHILMPDEAPERLQYRILGEGMLPAMPATLMRARCLRDEMGPLSLPLPLSMERAGNAGRQSA
ncbi:MAG: N-acetyltransferase [Geminicoccaceae bacterium]